MISTADLLAIAEDLVRTRIPGTRKGSDEPAYVHSLRVRGALQHHGYSDEVVAAGLLHDIVEDGGMTTEELRGLGFSARTVELIGLCTHDNEIEGGDARWVRMLGRLIDANDPEAWAIKIADVTDNLKSSNTMPDDRRHFMRTIKAPLMLHVTYEWLHDSAIWKELAGELKKALG